MDILSQVYYKNTAENEHNLRFWESYLQDLKSLNFNTYSEKLKVPVLVPVGSRILFRGELKHTNEVTVALGADYFVKCSLAQADILRQHRIKVAQEKVDVYNKEKEYLENHISFANQNVRDDQGENIIEYHTEEEDKIWRLKHIENVKEYMQKRAKDKENEDPNKDANDEELWQRLEELELQEELENELNSVNDNNLTISVGKEMKTEFLVDKNDINFCNPKEHSFEQKDEVKTEKEMKNKYMTFKETKASESPSKLDLLHQVINRQNELGEKLHELKNRERTQSKTEMDLLSKLDELEQLDELEDEMDRLDDIIDNEDIDESDEEEPSKPQKNKLQRRVSFVDEEEDSETLNLIFKHSEVEPDNAPYNPEKGIQKPSDLYQAHSNLFENGVKSILKKSKYTRHVEEPQIVTSNPGGKVVKETKEMIRESAPENHDQIVPRAIVIKDVVEKERQDGNNVQTETKPMSLFKKKRMQNKS